MLALCAALLGGETLSARSMERLTPTREQSVQLWRALQRAAEGGELSGPELPLVRRLAAEIDGADSFLRTLVCLEVFAERGLVSLTRRDGTLSVRIADSGKVDIDACPYLRALNARLSGERRETH